MELELRSCEPALDACWCSRACLSRLKAGPSLKLPLARKRSSAPPRAGVPSGYLRPLVEDAHGERRPRSEGASRRRSSPTLARRSRCVTFDEADIAFVYGSKWKQRYFTKVGDDYFPLGAQWDVTHKRLAARIFVANGTDWWVPHYPADNMKRPTGPLCDGCHSVNYDVADEAGRPSGTSAARSATGPAASTSRVRSRDEHRQPGARWIRCARTTPASSATRRDSRSRTRSRGGTTTGRSASASG